MGDLVTSLTSLGGILYEKTLLIVVENEMGVNFFISAMPDGGRWKGSNWQ